MLLVLTGCGNENYETPMADNQKKKTILRMSYPLLCNEILALENSANVH